MWIHKKKEVEMFYILTLAKYIENMSESVRWEDKNRLNYRTYCYADEIIISKVRTSNNKILQIMKNDIPKELDEINSIQRGLHIQQNILLISDNSETVIDRMNHKNITSGMIYISFVNVYNPKVKPEIKIDDPIKLSGIDIFHALDHCDYIVVGNGNVLDINDYLEALNKIKNDGNTKDITTLYGFGEECTEEVEGKKNIFSAIINVEDQLYGKIEQQKAINIFGRYDKTYIFERIEEGQLRDILKTHFSIINGKESKNISMSNSTIKVHLGVPESYKDGEDAVISKEGNLADDTLKKLEAKVSELYGKYMEIINNALLRDAKQLVHAIKEIYSMICKMLQRGISSYYVLSIFESYCGFLQYIKDKILSVSYDEFKRIYYGSDKVEDLNNPVIDKLKIEACIDLTDKYYSCIRTLTSSMLHNERKYIYNDPFQYMDFDIPPKLVAFYTSIANHIQNELNGKARKHGRYKIMLIPDFKNEITVEAITSNRDKENELNLLVIHISEKSIYNIEETIYVIAHEIAHHIGLDRKKRRIRAFYCLKTFVALLLNLMFFDMNGQYYKDFISFFDNKEESFQLYEALIDGLYSILDTYCNFIENKDSNDVRWYYLDTLIESFVTKIDTTILNDTLFREISNYISEFLIKKCKEQLLAFHPNKKYHDDYTHYDFNKNGSIETIVLEMAEFKDNEFNTKVMAKYLANQFCERFIYSIEDLKEISFEPERTYVTFSPISYVFRESVADVRMISLCGKNCIDFYKNVFTSNLYEQKSKDGYVYVTNMKDDSLRARTLDMFIYPYRNHKKTKYVYSDELDANVSNNLFYNYICKETFELINKIEPNFLNHETTCYSVRNDIKKIVSSKNIEDVINTVDTEIENYVLNLIEDK